MERRPHCEQCGRPQRVCYCEWLPESPVRLNNLNVVVLQHPLEKRQAFNSVRIISQCIFNVEVNVGRTFKELAYENPVVLYPTAGATEEPPSGTRTVILLDGTWSFTRNMYEKNKGLRALPAWKLADLGPSLYAPLRQPPRAGLVSTADALASVLLYFGEHEGHSVLTTALTRIVSIENAARGQKKT